MKTLHWKSFHWRHFGHLRNQAVGTCANQRDNLWTVSDAEHSGNSLISSKWTIKWSPFFWEEKGDLQPVWMLRQFELNVKTSSKKVHSGPEIKRLISKCEIETIIRLYQFVSVLASVTKPALSHSDWMMACRLIKRFLKCNFCLVWQVI